MFEILWAGLKKKTIRPIERECLRDFIKNRVANLESRLIKTPQVFLFPSGLAHLYWQIYYIVVPASRCFSGYKKTHGFNITTKDLIPWVVMREILNISKFSIKGDALPIEGHALLF